MKSKFGKSIIAIICNYRKRDGTNRIVLSSLAVVLAMLIFSKYHYSRNLVNCWVCAFWWWFQSICHDQNIVSGGGVILVGEAIIPIVGPPFLVVWFMSTDFYIIQLSWGGFLCILLGSGLDRESMYRQIWWNSTLSRNSGFMSNLAVNILWFCPNHTTCTPRYDPAKTASVTSKLVSQIFVRKGAVSFLIVLYPLAFVVLDWLSSHERSNFWGVPAVPTFRSYSQ